MALTNAQKQKNYRDRLRSRKHQQELRILIRDLKQQIVKAEKLLFKISSKER